MTTFAEQSASRTERENVQNWGALPSVEYGLIRAHVVAALITVIISALFGILVATKFNFPEFLGGHSWLTWGRLRYDHTQGIFFGWLGNAFLASFYYEVPRLANRPVLSRKLGWILFYIWNFAVVLPGWILVLAGFSQPLEWAEFPLVVDAFVVLAFILMVFEFVVPFLKARLSDLYVSAWYLIGGIIFTMLAYPVGNFVPELVPGAQGAAFSGLWIHDAVGLFVTPFALAIAYYVIPTVTRRPIYSHFLSMVGFWVLFFIYPLNGTHHYVYSAIPMGAQKGAIVASTYLGMDVILVVTNLLLSLRGSSGTASKDVPLRFVWFGVISYLVVSLQGSVQAFMPVNRFIHFTDWVIGHSHLAMIGFASFVALGGIAHMWQRIPGTRYNERMMNWSFWLLAWGITLMVTDLTIAGLVEAQVWQTSAPWIDSVRAVASYWLVRTVSGVPIITGFVLFWISLVTGPRNSEATASETSRLAVENNAKYENVPEFSPEILSTGWLSYAHVVAFGAGVGFFALSFLVLAILPGKELAEEIKQVAPVTMATLTASEQRGRVIYGREGCAYCHTEQVRSLAADVRRFGAPTEAWETKYDYPQLWGTRRIGPDLSREYNLHPRDWQLTHLYNPRFVVRDSVMPPYPWLFAGNANEPTQEALDLLAYLQSLGRARQLAGFEQQALVPSLPTVTPDMAMPREASARATPPSVPIAMTGGYSNSAPVLHPASNPGDLQDEISRGQALFAANCASCHGASGIGDGKAAPSLLPKPANLTAARFSDQRLSSVLWNGIVGSSMPPWRQLPTEDLRALVAYVDSLHLAAAAPATQEVASLEVGKALFAAACASCHGATGAGNGPAAAALAPPPTNFRLKKPTEKRAWEVLEDGVPGTAMPPWKSQLGAVERHTLVAYVRSLYETPQEGPKQ
ncbi:MAG TPA: cbb3-type cytochrome c oxidase subunit I [Candidatus Sulfotelmatobacter sp.]|nr:cbb3-type cytochrome c oxidase subunit I [Candidatus Sulfotelmatobacter sp.]